MAYAPIANIIPQYENYPNYWLKAYEQGTTTPKVMGVDATPSSTAAKFELNANGFPITSGSALVIPYIDGAYDLWLFPTEAEADANDTGSAIQLADNIDLEPFDDSEEISYIPPFTGSSTSTVEAKLSESVSILDFGAVADLSGDTGTDNTTAINNAIDAVEAKGGGIVFVPAGGYRVTNNVVLKDNVYLMGEGYASHIRNTSSSGFSKCTVISGNMGDPSNSNSMFDETGYDFNAVTRGDFQVTLTTAGDASNFSVGDIIALQSFETWPQASPNNKGQYLHQNEVVSIGSGVLDLKYAIPDSYTSSAGNRPTVHRLSGGINGYDGSALFMSKNCGAMNLRLTQTIGLTSGWYALFPCGINQRYENIYMDDCSTAVGSNNLSYSYFNNIHARFEAGFLDFAEFVNNITVENCIGSRVAANASLNRIGIASSKGSDNTFRNVKAFLEGWGRIGANQCHRAKFIDCDVYGSGSASDTTSTEAILLGYGDDCEARNCKVYDQHKYGIQAVGERARITQCRIPSTNTSYTSVYCPATVDTIYVHDNEFGTNGSVTARDIFQQQTTQSANAKIYNNTGYIEHELKKGGVCEADFATTSATSYASLKSTTLVGGTGVDRCFKVYASGIRSGTTDTKDVRLRLGSNTIGAVSYAAPDTGAWTIEATIFINDGDNARVSYKAYNGTTLQEQAFTTISSAVTSDTTLEIQGQVTNAADSVAIYQFEVEAI